MGTRQQCQKCEEFFIIGQENEQCPHGQLQDDPDLELARKREHNHLMRDHEHGGE